MALVVASLEGHSPEGQDRELLLVKEGSFQEASHLVEVLVEVLVVPQAAALANPLSSRFLLSGQLRGPHTACERFDEVDLIGAMKLSAPSNPCDYSFSRSTEFGEG